MTETLLFLHVLAAFMLVATVVIRSSVALGADAPAQTVSLSNLLWDVGGIGTIVFGVWLAFDIEGYGIFDFWIIAAIVLWAIATELGRRAKVAMSENDASFSQWHWLSALVVLLLLLDMIFKPGA